MTIRANMWAIFSVLLLPAPFAAAQSAMDEIIVTGSRISNSFSRETIPVVHIRRRPDFMVVSAYIESDSRDRKLRLKEVNKTLESLAKRASSATNIELGLQRSFETENDEIEYVVPFNIDDVEIGLGHRPDTSRIYLIAKSPILDSDESPELVYERIEAFLDSVSVTGRAQVSDDGEMNFSLVNIRQYREPLLKKLAADSQMLKTVFGDDYKVSLGGFDQPVRWRVTGPMEMTIYFPYSSVASD